MGGQSYPLIEADVQNELVGFQGPQREKVAEAIRKAYNKINARAATETAERAKYAAEYAADKVKKLSPLGVAARGAGTYLGYSLGYAALGLGCFGLGYGIGLLIDKKIIKPLEHKHDQKVKDNLQNLRPMH